MLLQLIVMGLVGLLIVSLVCWLTLRQLTKPVDRMEGELTVARDIQLGMLRTDFPTCLHALLEPAKEVGGDLYDFNWRPDGGLYFAVGDVSGKGAPAALMMAITRAALRFVAGLGLSLGEAVGRVNNSVVDANSGGMFVTLFVGRLDPKTGLLRYCNGGHNPILVVPPYGEPYLLKAKANLALGVFADFQYEAKGQEKDFVTGIQALSKIAKTYVGLGIQPDFQTEIRKLGIDEFATLNIFDGPCPAGNVGVQVNHVDPVNKGEVVWTIGDPTVVLFIGRLFNTGKVDLRRTVALCGSEVKAPAYVDMLVGEELSTLLANSYDAQKNVRIINGNVLTGKPTTKDGYLGAHASEITVIPEGNDADEVLGWILPRLKQFSVSRSYFSWLQNLLCCGKKKQYVLDARIKGGERHMIMSGEYDKVIPMDIYGEYLIKAIITGDIDRQEALGIYEVSPEDFALAEFVDSSKLELQRIVREGLNILRKENA